MIPIVLTVHKIPKPSDDLIGTVRVTSEAEIILRQLARASGLSIREVASRIIVQAADHVEIREVK